MYDPGPGAIKLVQLDSTERIYWVYDPVAMK